MRTPSKTPLFLMEIVIMLLVFSLSAAVCLQIFVGARGISEESRRLDRAVLEAQTAAEYWKATGGDLDETAALMHTQAGNDGFSVFYEEEWMHLEFVCERKKADIDVLQGEEVIFSLECEAVMFGE